MRFGPVERLIAQLIDDDKAAFDICASSLLGRRDLRPLLQLLKQLFHSVIDDPVAELDCLDSEADDRGVLSAPGGPKNKKFSARRRLSQVERCSIRAFSPAV
jgi:hypothetical protein